MFFPAGPAPRHWTQEAASDRDPFADEEARAAAARKKRRDAGSARGRWSRQDSEAF
jgi:hypothetical protein